MNNDYSISTDNRKIEIQTIHDFISNRSYWGKGRTIEAVENTIENSFCFGVYDGRDQLVGFARVVTDFTVFAYLMDVFILEEHRGRGLGKYLLDYIFNHPELRNIACWRLDTNDAHGLYRKFGFQKPLHPDKIMERRS